MARLTIEQVKAPDFSASSEMMARANQSFISGIESAKGILDKYNSGQQAKADNALTQLLAQAGSEDELEKLLATTDISGMNISDKMRENYLGARGVILGNDATRQSTVNAADSNSRANAGESRVAAEYADGVAVRDEMRSLTPAYVSALAEGAATGRGAATGATPNDREVLAKTLQAEAAGEGYDGMIAAGAVIRNRVANGNYGGGNITDVIMKPGQFSAWNGVTGYAGGEGAIDMDNLQVSEEAYAAADAILTGNYEDRTGGATHYYNPNVANPAWGSEKAGGNWTDIGNHRFGNPDSAPGSSASGPVEGYTTSTSPVTSNGTGGTAAQEFAAALKSGTRLTPDQAASLFNSVLAGQNEGQSLIDAAESKRQTELAAEATRAAILDPNNTSETAVQRDLLSTPGLSFGNILGTAGQDLSTFGGVIAPTPAADAEVSAALERTRAEDVPTGDNVFALAQEFGNSENRSPVGPMFKSLGIDTKMDMSEVQTYDNAIKNFAEAAGVTPAEAAAALATLDSRDGIDAQRALGLFRDQEEYGTMVGLIKDLVGEDAKEANRVSMAERTSREAQRAATEIELTAAKTRAMKLPAGSPERAAAEAEIAAMRDTVIAGKTPQQREKLLKDYVAQTGSGSLLKSVQEDMAKYPEGTPEGDRARSDFFRVMTQLEDTIMADENLTDTEKELLLADIRG